MEDNMDAMHEPENAYKKLVLMGIIHFPIMYAVMFSMVYSWDEIFHNLNTFYMAGMMVAPMIILMPITMSMMYMNKWLNIIVYALSTVLFIAFLAFTRWQTFIGDRQFIRSMIPHHSGAVLMCEKASISDAELKTLCDEIIQSQKREIEQMKKILTRL
jgi:uncharacterized protein (DUF305 family)